MTAPKVWDGSGWVTATKLVGPPGPQGPEGPGAVPSGPAGNGLAGSYPDPLAVNAAAGGLLAVQAHWGQLNAYRTIVNGGQFMVNTVNPLTVVYTPSVPCWWEVECSIGIFQKIDAAYHLGYLSLNLSPVDADNFNQELMGYTQNAGVQAYGFRNVSAWWRLNAATAYTCTATAVLPGGSWQYHQSYQYLWMSGRAYAQ